MLSFLSSGGTAFELDLAYDTLLSIKNDQVTCTQRNMTKYHNPSLAR